MSLFWLHSVKGKQHQSYHIRLVTFSTPLMMSFSMFFAFLSSRIHKALFRNCSIMEHAWIAVGKSLSNILVSHIPLILILLLWASYQLSRHTDFQNQVNHAVGNADVLQLSNPRAASRWELCGEPFFHCRGFLQSFVELPQSQLHHAEMSSWSHELLFNEWGIGRWLSGKEHFLCKHEDLS